MKRIFQKWLLLFVAVAFMLTFIFSYFVHSYLAEKSATELLRVKLNDAARQFKYTRNNLQTVRDMSNSAALVKAWAFARIIEADPAVLKDRAKMEEIRRRLDVDELHVSDDKGILIASIPQEYEGYAMGSAEQSGEFMPAIGDRDFALVQEPRRNGILKQLFQYAGVGRLDAPGIVQIGYRPERLEAALKIADLEHIALIFRIGNNGVLRIEKTAGAGVQTGEKVFYETVDGRPSICMAIPCGEYTLIGNLPEDEMYLSRNSVIRILVIGNLVLFAVIFILVTKLLQKIVIKGIYRVNAGLGEITNGNLDERIEVATTAEFAALSSGINTTVDALKKAIETEARRIDAELEVGRTIQTSALPVEFPDNSRVKLFAAMYTAKEVGGDFYDFFMIDEDRLALIVADVSGKGITAALYMMTTKTLLKDLVGTGMDLAAACAAANLELCGNNRANMFVTAFAAVLNLKTGQLECVNAGHNPPLLKRAGAAWEYLRIKRSLVLGASPKSRYTKIELQLSAGDRLFLYTDGVTEAQNRDGRLFGEARLLELLDRSEGTPDGLIHSVRGELTAFAEGAPQSDDITMMAVDYLAAGNGGAAPGPEK